MVWVVAHCDENEMVATATDDKLMADDLCSVTAPEE